jgi:hypothetical protein
MKNDLAEAQLAIESLLEVLQDLRAGFLRYLQKPPRFFKSPMRICQIRHYQYLPEPVNILGVT